jgi:transketolase
LGAAFGAFWAETERPTLIVVDSIIGYGSPTKAGTHSAHGEPPGVEEVKATKRFYGWPADETFLVPAEVADHAGAGTCARGGALSRDWEALFSRYAAQYPSRPPSSTTCSGAPCPRAGTPTSRAFPPTHRACPAATPTAKCSTRSHVAAGR